MAPQVFGGADVTALADYFLLARVSQALVHCISVSALAINVRFALFVVQMLLMAQIGWQTHFALHK
jgi:hypothetical protein